MISDTDYVFKLALAKHSAQASACLVVKLLFVCLYASVSVLRLLITGGVIYHMIGYTSSTALIVNIVSECDLSIDVYCKNQSNRSRPFKRRTGLGYDFKLLVIHLYH